MLTRKQLRKLLARSRRQNPQGFSRKENTSESSLWERAGTFWQSSWMTWMTSTLIELIQK